MSEEKKPSNISKEILGLRLFNCQKNVTENPESLARDLGTADDVVNMALLFKSMI